jgi:hypothetical protein
MVPARIGINLGDNFLMRQIRESVSSNKVHSRRTRVRRVRGLNEEILDEIDARLEISPKKLLARRAHQMGNACDKKRQPWFTNSTMQIKKTKVSELVHSGVLC